MTDNESEFIWSNVIFCRKLALTREYFQRLFRDTFRGSPPHEAFVGWFLTLCSLDGADELEHDVHDYPSLNPLLRYVTERACVAVDLMEAVNEFSKSIKAFWHKCDCENQSRDWLCAYIYQDSIQLSYPEGSNRFIASTTALSNLQHTHKGSCFASDVCILFLKYDSLFGFGLGEGRGWQLSIPDEFYHLLRSEFSLGCELFASPINHRCVYYFSLFSSDSAFGSLGNFFRSPPRLQDFLTLVGNPDHLTIEANPPFQPLVMMRFARRLTSLLSEADDVGYALLGILILPFWPTCEPINFLRTSPYAIHSVLLGKGEHKYKSGWADAKVFEADPAYWKNSESLILFLGSEKSRCMHRFSDMMDSKIRQSWLNFK